ncbi:polysialyltransferase family glycosyltransferase [Vibrio splendidus]|uniref:polysialyltransferase family glycosyltransferase n=1 Tax=Vibrio splendidus TaxID=29497 RepID=UPI00352CC963
MNHIFIIRNLLSLKASSSIKKEMSIDNSLNLYLGEEGNAFNIIKGNMPKFEKIYSFTSIAFGGSMIEFRRNVIEFRQRVKEYLLESKASEIYITNPIHLDTSVFFFEAKKLGIKVNFYEEGICFYRGRDSKQYKVKNLRSAMKFVIYRFLKIYQGYDKLPDNWFSSLPFYHESIRIKLEYDIVEEAKKIKYLFLSRPASDDFPGVKIEDEIIAIKAFYVESIKDSSPLYIKFHPREGKQKRKEIIDTLKANNLNIQELNCKESSEDVVFSMESGSVGGYETTTLVYCQSINPVIKVYSVAEYILGKDKSGTISDFVSFYKKEFSHITYIYNK